MRRLFTLVAIAFPLLVASAGGAGEHLPEGTIVAGVPVGGLGPYAARIELQRQLAPVWEAPIEVRLKRRRLRVPTARLGQTLHYKAMVDLALRQAARGQPVDVHLIRTIGSRRLSAGVRSINAPFYRAPRNARVRLGIRRVARIPGRFGRTIDTRRLRRDLLAELRRPTRRRSVRAHTHALSPAIRVRTLRRVYGTYISVDRRSKLVRLFKHLRRVRTYRVAVGAAGYDTPSGLHHVLSKERNPTWHVPNRAWAGSLAGQTIPPGDPRNPLKARFIAIGSGVGFHGTADLASIGRAASHGCIRMRIPDVISLYNRTPVGTPVLVR